MYTASQQPLRQPCLCFCRGDDVHVADRRAADASLDGGAPFGRQFGRVNLTGVADERGHRDREGAGPGADVSDLHTRLQPQHPRQARRFARPRKRGEEERESPRDRASRKSNNHHHHEPIGVRELPEHAHLLSKGDGGTCAAFRDWR